METLSEPVALFKKQMSLLRQYVNTLVPFVNHVPLDKQGEMRLAMMQCLTSFIPLVMTGWTQNLHLL